MSEFTAEHQGHLNDAVAKVKRRILPLFIVMFIVNYLDRVNVGFIQQHLKTDLGLDSAAYGLGAGLFFIGYAIFEVPSNILLQKFGARVWLTRITISWGVVASLMALPGTRMNSTSSASPSARPKPASSLALSIISLAGSRPPNAARPSRFS